MLFSVRPAGRLEGKAKAPPSKSLTHRAFTAGMLASGKSGIHEPLLSGDTNATLSACRAFGADAVVGEAVEIEGVAGKPKTPKEMIDCRNSGTTLRIMTSIAALCGEEVLLGGDESLQKRPMQPLLSALEEFGVETSSNGGLPPVSVKGPLSGGEARIPGDISSQYISGLLLACPLAGGDARIVLTSALKSRPYLDLTLDVMEAFNVRVELEDDRFYIASGQEYRACDFQVEGDYSSAAFILAAAALTDSDVSVSNLRKDSRQGDRGFIDILEKMGSDVSWRGDSVRVRGGNPLYGVDLDMSQTPDLVPITAVLACLAEGRTRIRNVEHLRYKESDRLRALACELSKLGADIREREDGLEICGGECIGGARVSSWGDHRIAMSLAVAALRSRKEVVVEGAESVDISFPGFAQVMRTLGMQIEQRQG